MDILKTRLSKAVKDYKKTVDKYLSVIESKEKPNSRITSEKKKIARIKILVAYRKKSKRQLLFAISNLSKDEPQLIDKLNRAIQLLNVCKNEFDNYNYQKAIQSNQVHNKTEALKFAVCIYGTQKDYYLLNHLDTLS